MIKVFICLFITFVLAFLGCQSFVEKDSGPLRQWMVYYQAYQELQHDQAATPADKIAFMSKLKAAYPQEAARIEAYFKEKYGDLQQSTDDEDNTSYLSNTLHELATTDKDSEKRQQAAHQDEHRTVHDSDDTHRTRETSSAESDTKERSQQNTSPSRSTH